MTPDEPANDDTDGLFRRTILRLSALATGVFAANSAARSSTDPPAGLAGARTQGRPDITGFHPPQIDGIPYGHTDEQLPRGKAGEWADAQTEPKELISPGGQRRLEAQTFTKMVGTRLYFGIRIPPEERERVDSLSAGQFSRIQLYVDRSGSGELSEGDVRYVGVPVRVDEESQVQDPAEGIQAVQWTVEIFQNGEFDEIDGVEPGQSAASMMARDTEDGGLGIETHVDHETLDELLDGDFEDKEAFNGNFQFTSDDTPWGVGYDPRELPENYQFGGSYNIDPIPFPIDNSELGRLEVTQSVQNTKNSLPLARKKQTLARVFVDHPESSPIEVEVTIEAKALTSDGGSKWVSLGKRSKTATVPPKPHSRDEFKDTVNFELPASWRSKGRLLIGAHVNRPGHFGGSDQTDWAYVVLGETYNPRLFVGRVDGPNGRPSTKRRDFHVNAFRRLMPIDNVPLFWFWSGLINNVSGSDALLTRLDRIARYLKTTKWSPIDQVFGLTVSYPGAGGLSSPSWSGGPDNHLAAWGRHMWAPGASSSMDHIMAHEIDHNIGGKKWAYHLGGPCDSGGGDSDYSSWRTGQVGWSPAYNTMIPKNHPELMSYCNSRRKKYGGPNRPFQWVSEYRWIRLYDRLQNWVPGNPKHSDFGGPSPSLASYDSSEHAAGTAAGYPAGELEADGSGGDDTAQESTARVISGFLYPDGSGTLLPSFEFPGETEVPSIQAEEPAAILRVGYTDQTVEVGVRASFETTAGEQVDEMGFNYAFPDDGEINSITLVDADTEEVLDSFEATDFFVEEAGVDVPQAFDRGQETEVDVFVQAQSQVQLHRQLLYSPAGENWLPITGAFTADSVPVAFTDGPGGEAARFLLLVSDGVRTQQFESDTFTVPSEPPKVRIDRAQRLVVETEQSAVSSTDGSADDAAAGTDEPIDGTIKNVAGPVETVVGATVSFQAYGTTEQGETLDPQQFEWTIEGPQGEQMNAVGSLAGERMIHRFARPGTYTVGVTGTDSQSGLSSSDDIDVVVSPPPLPDAAALQEFQEAKEAETPTETPRETPMDTPTATPTDGVNAEFTVDPNFLRFFIPRKRLPFDASASEGLAGEIEEYAWDFDGDGQFETRTEDPTTTHVFEAPGEYAVTLRVTDVQGNTDTTRQTLLVRRRVRADIKPGEDGPARINPTGGGVTPVAILGEGNFDPGVVDVDSLAFGPPDVVDPETDPNGASAERSGPVDVNDDDVPDLGVLFPTREAGFEQGDEVGAVVGTTDDGVPLVGADLVKIVGSGGGNQ